MRIARWQPHPSRPDLALAAVALHAWYTGLDRLLERVVRQLDGEVPEGDSWHRELLFQVTTTLPGVRPAVLPEALRDGLFDLLGFRHFFRHAYRVDLDPARVRATLDRLLGLEPKVIGSLDALRDDPSRHLVLEGQRFGRALVVEGANLIGVTGSTLEGRGLGPMRGVRGRRRACIVA